jgi:hypothetical protein
MVKCRSESAAMVGTLESDQAAGESSRKASAMCISNLVEEQFLAKSLAIYDISPSNLIEALTTSSANLACQVTLL